MITLHYSTLLFFPTQLPSSSTFPKKKQLENPLIFALGGAAIRKEEKQGQFVWPVVASRIFCCHYKKKKEIWFLTYLKLYKIEYSFTNNTNHFKYFTAFILYLKNNTFE